MRYTDLNLQLDGQDVVMADEFTGPGILALLQGVDGAGSGSGRADSGGPASCLGVAQRSCYGLCRG